MHQNPTKRDFAFAWWGVFTERANQYGFLWISSWWVTRQR
jgi:hypothetical protein